MSAILIAPFSNGDIRDWQPDHFSALIGLLLDRWQGPIRVIGTRSQATRAAAIVRPFDATRVISDCGHLTWNELLGEIANAACVIGNNSGVTHLSGSIGIPTVGVFAGSHRRSEWYAAGDRTLTLSRVIGCSPCHLHRAHQCPYGKACLSGIEPEAVAVAALGLIREKEGGAAHDA